MSMASRYQVEVTIISATHLKNINWRHGHLIPYAVVWIDPNSKCSTQIDDAGDSSPYWNQKLLIPFNTPLHESYLHIDIVHAQPADDTKPLIGSTRFPLRDAVDDVGFGRLLDRTLDLKRPSGRPHGKLQIAITVSDPSYRAPEPYYGAPYGVPPPGSRDYVAPPPQYSSPYGAPPQPAYGAPNPATAYGGSPGYGEGGYYGQLEYVEEKKKSKFGGMGTGLAVGAAAGILGGLAIAEGVDALEDHIADDVAERVEDDSAYDDDDY